MYSKRAFTLIEIIIASVIMVFILMAVLSTYVLLSQYVRDTIIQANLQNRSRIVLDRITRDIRLASSVTSCPPSGTSIIIRFIPEKLGLMGDPWESRYRLLGGQVLYTPDIDSPAETVILNNVALDMGDRLFEYDGGNKLVTINAKVKNVGLNRDQISSLITVVELRNAD